jgi:DNA repair protein RecO
VDQPHSSRDLCYVLKTTPYQDRDLIAVMLSETRGKFTGIARNGVQSRRFGGSLDLFTASDFELDAKTIRLSEMTDESIVLINSAIVKNATTKLSKSFEKLSAASCLNEILIKGLPTQRPAEEVFKLYANCLFALEEQDDARAVSIVNAFILKFTQWLGLQPSLTRCSICEKQLSEISGNGVRAQLTRGNWVCLDCTMDSSRESGGRFLSKTLLLDAYHSMLHPIRKIVFEADVKEHEGLLEFLEQHLLYFVPGLDKGPLTTTRFLRRDF